MNIKISDFGMDWTAGDNAYAAMYYEDKKSIFGEKYNLLGFEMYSGGVFEFVGYQDYETITGSLLPGFDWRSRHDANKSSSLYYDGDTLNTGWHTAVKNQESCNYCWTFAPLGAIEGVTNLYFNQMVDPDLSEEYVISCGDFPGGNCSGFYNPDAVYPFIKSNGIIPEYCFPYQDVDPLECDDTCTSQHYRLRINDTIRIKQVNHTTVDADSIKKSIINFGPMSAVIKGDHSMVLSGWQDDFNDSTTIWIFKNSWGQINDEEHLYGFRKMKLEKSQLAKITGITTPVYLDDTTGIAVNCYDKDGDGYYWWGIGPKPDTCPTCPDQKDANDNDPLIGPFDSCYRETCNYQYSSESIHITSDTTWNSAMIIQNTVYVDSGYSLTIRSDVKFVEHSGIIVKQGGKLNIYGGTLTKACHELWRGVEVWGHYDTTQYFSGVQGVIKIDSNAIIEYAEIGIILGSRDIDPGEPYPYLRSGGIIMAKNSSFLNNTIDVEFQPYRNIHPYDPKTELTNGSYFYNCIFQTNNNDNYYYPPDKHLVLKQVKGIEVLGCTFSGTDPDSLHAIADRYKGYGIYAMGSSFKVDNYCSGSTNPCPDTCIISGSFQNLRYGVYALEWNTSRLVTIDSSTFSNNICSIYLSGTTNSSVSNNTFDVQSKNHIAKDTICGLYLDACTGYFIEENHFYSNYAQAPPGLDSQDNFVGLYVKNSGTANNEIYNNSFEDNYYSTIVEGINRGDSTGLCIKCNDYTDNMNDIFVVPDTSLRGLRIKQGIAEYQGTVADTTTTGPAGNTFTEFNLSTFPDSVNIRYFNYLNDTTEYFNYMYHSYSLFEPRIYPRNVNDSTELIILQFMDEEYKKNESCPSSFIEDESLAELKNQVAYEESLIDQLQSDMSTNEDGGNTTELLEDIENSNPNQSNELRQQLMDNSPFLSDTVISLSIEKESVLPNPYLRDIMSANPHIARKENHLEQIDERNVSMPDYMKEQIRDSKYQLDMLDLIKSEKFLRENKKDKYLNNLSRKYLADTLMDNAADSIILLIQNEPCVCRKIQISYSYLSQGDTINARNSINAISTQLNLNATEDSIIADYAVLLEVIIAQQRQGFSETSLDSIGIAELYGIKANKLPLVSIYAGNLLAANSKLVQEEKCYFPSSVILKNRRKVFAENEFQYYNEYLRLIPNPTSSNVLVDYHIEVKVNYYPVLKAYTVNGIEIYSQQLDHEIGQSVINVNSWKPGIYFILIKGGYRTIIEKLIVTN